MFACWEKILNMAQKPVSIAPLVIFRVLFGAAMTLSTCRFWALGWIHEHFIQPKFMFKYFGFGWVEVAPSWVMYLIHAIMILSSLGILFGFFYRFFTILFFILFTYIFLLDATYYLNHYYFVCLMTFILCFLPANAFFAIDIYLNPQKIQKTVPFWCIFIIQFQLAVTYIYAGLVKINYDWLFLALPLKIWLPAQDKIPIIGFIFKYSFVAYLLSWVGMLYDLSIVLWLSLKKTKNVAYLIVILFHILTGILFQIGIFPLVMIFCTTIFLDANLHKKILAIFITTFYFIKLKIEDIKKNVVCRKYFAANNFFFISIGFYIIAQILIPLRFLFYDESIFWTDEGYRFSWRVMLAEKSGSATFYITDKQKKRTWIVDNRDFLTIHQEKQMAIQPDFILQYAHFLYDSYKKNKNDELEIKVESFLSINGRASKLYIDSTLNLASLEETFSQKNWVLNSKN